METNRNGLPICDRCKNEATVWIMSWFNTQHICLDCSVKEKKHPDFKKAHDKAHEEELKGNLNYPGIGLPDDLLY